MLKSRIHILRLFKAILMGFFAGINASGQMMTIFGQEEKYFISSMLNLFGNFFENLAYGNWIFQLGVKLV